MYLLFIWNIFYFRLAYHDTLEVPQYHRVGWGVVTLPPSRGGVVWTSNSTPYISIFFEDILFLYIYIFFKIIFIIFLKFSLFLFFKYYLI